MSQNSWLSIKGKERGEHERIINQAAIFGAVQIATQHVGIRYLSRKEMS